MWRALSIAGLTVLLLAGLPAALASQQPVSEVVVGDFAFRPPVLRVTLPEGSGAVEVRWVNGGPSDHTVTANGGAFDSRSLARGASFSFRFQTEGTFDYHCAFHETMRGQIVVTRAREDPGYEDPGY